MSCTTTFRTTGSFLNKAPRLPRWQGHDQGFLNSSLVVCNGTSVTRLLTSRHFTSISKALSLQNLNIKSIHLKKRETSDLLYSHNRCFCQENTGRESTKSITQNLKEMTIKRLEMGYTKVPDERDVTSLPPEINFYNAQYIAVEVRTFLPSPASDLIGIYAVSDTEQFIKICRHDRGLRESHRISMGLDCDENGNIRSSNGQLIETVEPQEAMQEFLKFIKKYDNTFLLVYDGPPNAVERLRYSLMRFGMYEEFISSSPYYIDLFRMARAIESVPSYKLEDLCKSLLNMDVNKNSMSRVTGMKKLFTDVLLKRVFSPVIKCTDYFCAKDCYAEMVAENRIHPLVVEKLAKAGLRIDHLKFLKQQGREEFEKQLKKFGLFDQDVVQLLALVK